jgi:hypothetical protein
MTPQGIATYPGVQRLQSASFVLTHGISPSVAQLSIAPQATPPSDYGTLRFMYDSVVVELTDCKIDHGTVDRDTGGEIVSLSILDRRWRWRFGRISGYYNTRRDDASLRKGESGEINSERTPRELAKLCLEAMGETDFDVEDLPNQTRPTIEWDNVVPAEALAALCEDLGCRVVLQFDNRVAIRRIGIGAELPLDGVMQHSPTINLPERPDKITVVGGPTRYQVDFHLEAVGLTDEDGEESDRLKPLEELSYKPTNGWQFCDPPFFNQVAAGKRSLAQKSVFKYYRIKAPLNVPGYEGPDGNRVDRLEQILPIETEQVKLVSENGQKANKPATVYGVWYHGGLNLANGSPSLAPLELQPLMVGESQYRRPFTVDAARGLVIFDEPVIMNSNPFGGYSLIIAPAQLVLRATCMVRHRETRAFDCYQRERSTGASGGTKPRYLKHDELLLVQQPKYTQNFEVDGVHGNRDELDTFADEILDAAELDYATTTALTMRYPGLRLIELDGAIQQVSLHVSTSGATTTISRGNELPNLGRSYLMMRRLERQTAQAARQSSIESFFRPLLNKARSMSRSAL